MSLALQPLVVPFAKLLGLLFLGWFVWQCIRAYMSISEVK